MAKRKNPAPYAPPGHYVERDSQNRPHIVKAYPLPRPDQLAALLRFTRRVARGELAPDVARKRAQTLVARIDSERLDRS